jgi:6-phosphogluconolactonase
MSLHAIRRTINIALVSGSLLFLTQPFQALGDDDGIDSGGFVYVMTNQASNNTVLVFHRNADGSVSKIQEVSTHGQGSGGGGDPLGSQGALTLSDDGRLLLAVDAGSNEVSSLAVTEDGLQFVNKASSGGTKPVSVALRGDTAYVLNAGGTPNVAAFRIDFRGNLTMIGGSTRALPGGANAAPAQVGISPDGEVLVVTEKNTSKIDLFPIDDATGAPSTVLSDGATPFGFTFGRDRTLIVSEAAASTFSSYQIQSVENSPTLQTITKSLPDGGAAACWIVTDGRFAFAANSASNTISCSRCHRTAMCNCEHRLRGPPPPEPCPSTWR